MKILNVGDIHFGHNCQIPEYVNYQIKEFDNMVNYAVVNDIKLIVFEGDIFDNRSSIYIDTLRIVKQKFKELEATGIKCVIIVGNHDTFYKNTNILNTPQEVFDSLNKEQFKIVYNEPYYIKTKSKTMLFVPWMNKANYEVCMNEIQNAVADYCFGHFEINGFVMNNNNTCKSTLNASSFKAFKKVFSGHFHTQSSQKNILYTGSFVQINRSDVNLNKGFFVLDTKTDTVEKIESPNTIFKDLIISPKFTFKEEYLSEYTNSFLKVYINRSLTKPEELELNQILSKNISFEIIDNTIIDMVQDIEVSETEDVGETITLCINAQEELEEQLKKDVIEMVQEFYAEMIGEVQ